MPDCSLCGSPAVAVFAYVFGEDGEERTEPLCEMCSGLTRQLPPVTEFERVYDVVDDGTSE